MKKLAWTALVAAVSAVMTRVAVRALERMWRRVTKENPPPQPFWAKFLVGRTMRLASSPS
ncbi:MAG TPA: hypothetical protein VFS15_19255 [Kofleriaceae bacterium]|nr:hypothetical protein [Kofleriaceae bacterium]